MNRVIAVVVTYNRQQQLSKCIQAIRNQTLRPDNILVINNGSTDNTVAWLREQDDLEFITQSNVGGSGGFARGVKEAFQKKYSWLWMMDDDGFPREDALEKLLGCDDEEMCMRNCAVVNAEDKETFVWKTGSKSKITDTKEKRIYNVAHPFNGTLLHRRVIEKVGLPKDNLFLWGDETEYLYRISRKYNIPCYTQIDSVHYHPLCPYSYKNDWEFQRNWKMYYYVRNRFHILKTKYSQSIVLSTFMYLVFLCSFAGTVILFQRTHKLRKLSFLVWPIADAFTNNTRATPSLILERLSISPAAVLQHYISYPFRFLKLSFSSAAA